MAINDCAVCVDGIVYTIQYTMYGHNEREKKPLLWPTTINNGHNKMWNKRERCCLNADEERKKKQS